MNWEPQKMMTGKGDFSWENPEGTKRAGKDCKQATWSSGRCGLWYLSKIGAEALLAVGRGKPGGQGLWDPQETWIGRK